MVRTLGAEPDARPVRQPEPAALGLLCGYLQPLAPPPDPLDPLVVHDPARGGAQQLGDLAVAVAAVPAGQLDEVGGELFLVVPAPRELALLRRAVLAERGTGTTLGDLQHVLDVLDTGTPASGA